MRALLDVNVWIALFDDAHQFSDRANLFIAKKSGQVAICTLFFAMKRLARSEN